MSKLKKVNTDFIKLILIMIIVIVLPLIKFLSYTLLQYNVVNDVFAINQVYILWWAIPFLIIIYFYDIFIKKKKFDKFDYIIFGLIIITIISTMFSVSRRTALTGRLSRYEGLYSLISYYLIFLVCKSIKEKKYIKIILNTFMIVGIFQMIYGVLQVYGNFNFIKLYGQSRIASGLCGNPNFFGSYIVLLLGISTTLYLFLRKKIYLLYTVMYFLGLCICGSLGPFLTYIIVLIFISIYLLKTKKSKLRYYVTLLFSLIFVYFCINNLPVIINKIQENMKNSQLPKVQVSEEINVNNTNEATITQESSSSQPIFNIQNEIDFAISNPNQIDTGRIEIWKNTLSIVGNHWLVGVGPDNLGNYYPHTTKYVDKAHNIYLHTLVTTGIFSLIFYCILCLLIFIKGFKSKDSISIALWISFIGYCVQGFVNISVIDVAPYFFMVMGLFLSLENIDQLQSKKMLYK